MSTKLPQEESFTTSLKRFLLRYLLGSVVDKVSVEMADAIVIAEKDKAEKYVHVQFESFSGERLEEPLVWHIKEWRSTYLKWQMDKARAERERKEACLLEENSQLLVKSFMRETGLVDDEMRKIFYKVARRNAAKKDDKIAETFKVKFDKGE